MLWGVVGTIELFSSSEEMFRVSFLAFPITYGIRDVKIMEVIDLVWKQEIQSFCNIFFVVVISDSIL